MIRALKTIVFAAVFSLTQWGCSFSPFNASGGSGADVETRVQGAVVDSSGKPVAGASVFLRPGGYVFPIRDLSDGDPGTRVDAITDHAGKYLIDSIGSGSYVIEINNRNGLAVAVRFATPDNGGTADLGVSTFERTGAIFGTIPAEARAGKQWFVQIYGLERIATADFSSGTYSFSDIPAGRYYLRLITPSPGFKPIDSCSVTVPSGIRAVAPTYPVWRYGRTLTLNTTPAGAGVSGDVVHFPLLVRLTSKKRMGVFHLCRRDRVGRVPFRGNDRFMAFDYRCPARKSTVPVCRRRRCRFDQNGGRLEFVKSGGQYDGNRPLSRRRFATRPFLQREYRRGADFEHGGLSGLDKIVLYEPEGTGCAGEMVTIPRATISGSAGSGKRPGLSFVFNNYSQH